MVRSSALEVQSAVRWLPISVAMAHVPAARAALAAGLLAAALAGCGAEEASTPEPAGPASFVEAPAAAPAERPRYGRGAHARKSEVAWMRQDLHLKRHASDGGGRAWLEEATPVAAGQPGRFVIVYEAGELGIATGGSVALQISPFWEWSTPQTEETEAPGYTTVEAQAKDVQLEPRTMDKQLLGIRIAGGRLAPGERVRITYGAGKAGARADRFAERESPFWIAVDGDGDGVRERVRSRLTVDVAPGPPALLVLHLPAVARPGQEVTLTVAVLDEQGSAGVSFAGEIEFGEHAPSVTMPAKIALAPADRGLARVPVRASAEGILRVRATGPGELEGWSNPMRISAGAPRILFGDLHGHSNLSDGTGTPEDYYAYARDVAALDFAALSDHDHWGIPFLDARPDLQDRIRRATDAAHEDGHFVALHAFEWTSWIYGHRHVLYFGAAGGPWYSWIAPETETPEQLWEKLRGQPAMTLAHHSAGGPIATDWTIPPDPELEPLTEIVSVHGSSEAPDSPHAIYAPVAGNFVRDALGLGYRLGFVGSGDSHDGHPGLVHLASGTGGLAAVFSEEVSREALRSALTERRAYATNGPRILLDVRLAGQQMGRILSAATLGQATLVVDAIGVAELERVDLVRSGAVVASADVAGRSDVLLSYPVRGLRAGEYLYVRVVQRDGGAAWSSPFFVE